MDNSRLEALKALTNLKVVLTDTPADVVRSLSEASEIRRTLNQIFMDRSEEPNCRSTPVSTLQPPPNTSSPETITSTPPQILKLIDAINHSRETFFRICTSDELKSAVNTQTDWEKDIQIGNVYNNKGKALRKTLAQRGLAEEYRKWWRHLYKYDVIIDLTKNLNCRTKTGTFDEFLKARKLSKNHAFNQAHSHGINMLLIEKLVGEPIISVILNFSFDLFRAVKRSDFHILCEVVQKSEWMMAFAKQLPGWVEDHQTVSKHPLL